MNWKKGEGLFPEEAEILQRDIAAGKLVSVAPGYAADGPPPICYMRINRRHFRAVPVTDPKEWMKD